MSDTSIHFSISGLVSFTVWRIRDGQKYCIGEIDMRDKAWKYNPNGNYVGGAGFLLLTSLEMDAISTRLKELNDRTLGGMVRTVESHLAGINS